ncbi:MAG: hypothetical protein KGL39_57410 [Patescibacteria group bacterium]|nr:hypothetical protein [Patescibacteria group bacterium]
MAMQINDYEFTITDEHGNTVIEYTCNAAVSLDWINGEEVVSVDAIVLHGTDITRSRDPFIKSLVAIIANKVEADESILDQLIAENDGDGGPAGNRQHDARLAARHEHTFGRPSI